MGLFDFILGTPEDRFAKRAMARLRQRGWDGPLTYARDRFALESDDEIYFLDRMFADWLTYPQSERTIALDEALHAFFEPPITGSYEEIAHLLTPIVRSRHELGGGGFNPVRPLPGALWVTVALDRPYSIQYLTHQDLERLGRSFDQLLDRALQNQRAGPACAFELQDDGYHAGDYGEVYASSRLLQPEIFQALPLKGAPVVMVPARGVLLVAGAEDPDALDAMAGFGEYEAGAHSRSISYVPLVLEDGAWTPFQPGPDARPRIRLLHLLQQAWDYAETHDDLKAALEAKGEELFVARFDISDKDDRFLSFATWTDDVATLLPKTEALILHDADWNSLRRRWEDVEAVCGPFVQEPDLDPPRLRTGAPPDAAAWARLRDEFGPPAGWGDLD